MNSRIRTDLALEAEQLSRLELSHGEKIPGIRCSERLSRGFTLSTVEVLDSRGEAAIGKPPGRYVSLEIGALLRRKENAFAEACSVLAGELRGLLRIPDFSTVLVAGLGNRDITPDAIGPLTLDSIMVTRHLREAMPEHFHTFRPVCALKSGVLGTTGMESGQIISAVCARLRPAAVVAVDALASRSTERLCRTVQLSDTGIVPGSGVGNAREALNRETLGIPVISVGVPTVVDAATLAADLLGADAPLPQGHSPAADMFVTPRDIDRSVRDMAKLIGYSINLALHKGLSVADVDMFLS